MGLGPSLVRAASLVPPELSLGLGPVLGLGPALGLGPVLGLGLTLGLGPALGLGPSLVFEPSTGLGLGTLEGRAGRSVMDAATVDKGAGGAEGAGECDSGAAPPASPDAESIRLRHSARILSS